MKIIIISFLIIFPFLISAQEQRWEVIIGEPNRNETVYDIIETYDKGYYLGARKGTSNDGWHIKTNINGGIQYDKTMAHNDCLMINESVLQDENGNTYMCGPVFFDGDNWPFVAKFDSCGEKLWCKHFPGEFMESDGVGWDIEFTHNGDILILSSYYSWEIKSSLIYLICVDQEGNEMWKRPYSSNEQYPLMEDPYGWDLISYNNEYYIAGHCYYAYPNDTNHVFLRPLFIGIGSNFEEKWVTPFMALDSVFGQAFTVKPLNDSTLIGAGYRYTEGEDKNSIIMLINKDGVETGLGQISNSSIFPNVDFNAIENVHQITKNKFLSPIYLGIEGVERYGEIVYDISGNVINSSNRGEYNSDYTSIKTGDSAYLVSLSIYDGQSGNDILLYKIDQNLNPVPFDTTQHVYDSLCPHTIQSGEMDLTDCLVITGIDDWPTPDEYYESIRWIPITAFPNPVTEGKLTLEFENTKHHQNMKLRCYDDFGRQIHSQKIYKGQQDTDVEVSGWSPGIYIAVVYSDGSARGKAKFVVR